MNFIMDDNGVYWRLDSIASAAPATGGTLRCTTDSGDVFCVLDCVFERAADAGATIPAQPGYEVWGLPGAGEGNEPFRTGCVVGWVVCSPGSDPWPIADWGGVQAPSSYDGLWAKVVVRRPDGSFYIPDDRTFEDYDELRQYVVACQAKRAG
ncbi:MAG: hypothetical protein Kow0032_28720 [Methyloligellaceae bacterium]